MERKFVSGVVLLAALSCCAAYGSIAPPAVTGPTIFAAAGQAIPVAAVVGGEPAEVTLAWNGGDVVMDRDTSGLWSAAIPAGAVKGRSLMCQVIAWYDGGSLASQVYTVNISPSIPVVAAKAMKVTRSVVVSRPWGSGDDAFGRDRPINGATEIPASIAADASGIHVLDTVNRRVLSFGKDGRLAGATGLRTSTASDLIPSAGGLLVVDQIGDEILQVAANGRVHSGALGARGLALGTKFAVDAAGAVGAAAPTVQVKANSVLVGLANGKAVEVSLGADVIDAAEVAVDGRGATWLLVGIAVDDGVGYALVRVQPGGRSAGVARISTFIPGDTTRRMVGTDNGALLLEGDSSEGRVVSFQLAGGVN